LEKKNRPEKRKKKGGLKIGAAKQTGRTMRVCVCNAMYIEFLSPSNGNKLEEKRQARAEVTNYGNQISNKKVKPKIECGKTRPWKRQKRTTKPKLGEPCFSSF
jgi:tRNA(Leu) C34 or U34 (ribose-2'-O)-methylase TrmL